MFLFVLGWCEAQYILYGLLTWAVIQFSQGRIRRTYFIVSSVVLGFFCLIVSVESGGIGSMFVPALFLAHIVVYEFWTWVFKGLMN